MAVSPYVAARSMRSRTVAVAHHLCIAAASTSQQRLHYAGSGCLLGRQDTAQCIAGAGSKISLYIL